MDAYHTVPFTQVHAIPIMREAERHNAGFCQMNIDGVCIAGGQKVNCGNGTGASGYQMTSMGYPATTCNAFPLFAGAHRTYAHQGWQVSTNAIPLRSNGLQL